jgi:hypothetical protein
VTKIIFDQRTCHHCHETYQPTSGIQKFCTTRCRNKFNYVKEQRRTYRRTNSATHRRKYRLKAYFGITLDEFDAMVAAQGGVCAICSQPERALILGEPKRLCIDHDHETGRVRGLLCNACNIGLGRFRDNLDNLRAAADYLERHAQGEKK